MATERVEINKDLLSENLSPRQKTLARHLWETKTVRLKNASRAALPSGTEIPPLLIDPDMMNRSSAAYNTGVTCLQESVKPLGVEIFAVPEGDSSALMLAGGLIQRTGIGVVIPSTSRMGVNGISVTRDEGKNTVLLGFDLVNNDPKLEAVDILRKFGLRVEHLVVLLDSQEGREQLAKKGVELHSTLTTQEIFRIPFYTNQIRNERPKGP